MYETYIAIFSASILIGLIAGHKLGQYEARLEYERGYLDAIWFVYTSGIKHAIESYTAKNNANHSSSAE